MIKKIYNIEANYNFLESFHHFFETNHINKKSAFLISQTKIFLPSTRSCRILKEIFIKKNPHKAFFLPKIKSISDLSIEDFFDLNLSPDDFEIINEMLKIKKQSDIENILFLAQEIKKVNNFAAFDQINSIQIAKNLKNLFDEIDLNNIDLSILTEIDDADFSRHRQVTIEFLTNFYSLVRNKIIKENTLSANSYQKLICEKFCQILHSNLDKNNQQKNWQNPLIIAGSTGSNFISKNLIKSIYQQENGEVFLSGFAADFFDCESEVGSQFHLSNLLNFLEIKAENIENIRFQEFRLSEEKQSKFINNCLIPSQKIDQWQKFKNSEFADLDQNKISIYNAKNQIEEAKLIAYLISNLVEEVSNIGVVVNSSGFNDIIKNELSNLAIDFNDTKSKKLSDLDLIKFLILLLELIESDFDSVLLISIFRSEFFKIDFAEKIISDFEIKIIRQSRSKEGLAGILQQIRIIDDQETKDFFSDFLSKIKPIFEIEFYQNFKVFFQSICQVIKNLTNIDFASFLNDLSNENDIKSLLNYQQIIDKKTASKFVKNIFSEITFFNKTLSFEVVQLVSSIEARLMNFDVIIIANLNDNLFPVIESENWLGKNIRSQLGIDKTNQKIGQNFYDFCNYFAAKKVILTSSQNIDSTIADKSIILKRIEAFSKKFNIDFDKKFYLNEDKTYLKQNLSNAAEFENKRSIGVADEKNYLKKLSITDIEKLISDPYSIYAKRILKLKKIKEIDHRSNIADFGSFVHKIAEIYVNKFKKNYTDFVSENNPTAILADKKFISEVEKIFFEFFPADSDLLIWLPKFNKIFTKFLLYDFEMNSLFDMSEIEVSEVVNNIEIVGKIDRVIINQNKNLEIIDYKTGQVPTIKSVLAGFNPQLILNALLLMKNIENIAEKYHPEIDKKSDYQIENIGYLKISLNDDGIVKVAKNIAEVGKLILFAQDLINNLSEIYAKKDAVFISCLAVSELENYDKNDYFHLARILDL